MVFFFSITTPAGIALGMGLSKIYSTNHRRIVKCIMALVDLLAADFMGANCKPGSVKASAQVVYSCPFGCWWHVCHCQMGLNY
ncbi:hypothetical protein C5167_036692 [Papaver somniferum]|uniref:Uncharacterized protein n=1 Tax=Papaver somniferum TaxID=3469 RepID=A0A4Y7I7F1_PAPSO|nr:hypothetical protein C5167_036692 [Papaver somniferum]